jgi:hypothetical protein
MPIEQIAVKRLFKLLITQAQASQPEGLVAIL